MLVISCTCGRIFALRETVICEHDIHAISVEGYVMLIIDALRRAGTAKEVCFLLTSYVETLQFYELPRQLPAAVTALPVRGSDDVALRLTELRTVCHLAPIHRSGSTDYAMLEEALKLFAVAHRRLQRLEAPDSPHYSFDRRASARSGGARSQQQP